VVPSWGAVDRCCAEAQASPYLEAGQWVAIGSYRYFHSYHDFKGDEEFHDPLIENDTYVDIFDFSAAYAFTKRFSVSLEIPWQYGSRTNKAEHDLVHVHTTRAFGMGDARVAGNAWLLTPETHNDYNVSLSLGIKIPSGEDDATDYFYRIGQRRPVLRPVDLAIQPGDGGWGIIFATNAFAKVYTRTYAFFQATYLSNPQEFSDTQTPFADEPFLTLGDKGYIYNSIPDQYLLRSGVGGALWPQYGISSSFAVRWEGIPAHDFIGGSDGYRLPGYSVSVEPGVSFSRGRHFFSVSAPIAIYRKGVPAIPDVRTKSPYAGVSSFSDYQINITYSHVF